MDRRAVLRNGAGTALGALALTTVLDGGTPAEAADRYRSLSEHKGGHKSGRRSGFKMGDPVKTREEYPWPKDLTREERRNLETFDVADFDVYSHQDWDRFDESHDQDVRVHWPDGHYTDGLDIHVEDMKAQFLWAPDIKIEVHPIRIAKGNFTAVTGVWEGTFTGPMPDGKGGFFKPTGKRFALHMVTIGVLNKRGVMEEEFLFFDQLTMQRQVGLA
ncbi:MULTISPECIES: ester cyclase [unclassified Streptomyces]|uniref:ester cyclase n=1 Tax=unclassified Streptomyces TaxID=2593676 RepID=UPI0037F2A23E